MSNYNHVTLIGILETKPEAKKIGKKTKASFKLAVERYAGAGKKTTTDYFNIVAWGMLAQVIEQHLDKGKKALIDGKLQVRRTSTGKWITEIVADNLKFLSVPKKGVPA